MYTKLGVWAVVALTAAVAWADDKPNPDQLKKAYDDALIQLRDAQNSKNELARENDRLKGQVDDLKKQLGASQRIAEDLQRRVADNDEKTFRLRSFYAAWQAFLQVHPELMLQWRRYLGDDALAVPQRPYPLLDLDFPIGDSDSFNGRG